jgi:hypothetical protein
MPISVLKLPRLSFALAEAAIRLVNHAGFWRSTHVLHRTSRGTGCGDPEQEKGQASLMSLDVPPATGT